MASSKIPRYLTLPYLIFLPGKWLYNGVSMLQHVRAIRRVHRQSQEVVMSVISVPANVAVVLMSKVDVVTNAEPATGTSTALLVSQFVERFVHLTTTQLDVGVLVV